MTVAAHLLRLRDPVTNEPLPDDLLAGEFGVFFGAGVETSGNAISWTVCVARHFPRCAWHLCEIRTFSIFV